MPPSAAIVGFSYKRSHLFYPCNAIVLSRDNIATLADAKRSFITEELTTGCRESSAPRTTSNGAITSCAADSPSCGSSCKRSR